MNELLGYIMGFLPVLVRVLGLVMASPIFGAEGTGSGQDWLVSGYSYGTLPSITC